MRPTDFPAINARLGAPANWDEATHGPCEHLPVAYRPGVSYTSRWKLSWMDRLRILLGGCVWVCLLTDKGHPPISLWTSRRDDGFNSEVM